MIFSVIALVFLAACGTSHKKADEKKETPATWSDQMQNMAKDVRELIPYLYDREAFHSPKNRDVIAATLKDWSEHAHKITPKMGEQLLGDDPLVAFSLQNLESDLKRSYQAFELSQLEYSRSVAKSSLNHCFRCHSLTQIGSTAHWELQNISQLNLSPTERADLLVASRKYDQALQYMEQLIGSDEFVQTHPFDYEAILRRYLALIIRAENNPSRALLEMDKVASRPDLPHYILEQVQGWRVSLQGWIREGKKNPHKMSPVAHAQEHINEASRLQQFPQDHAGDVEYLRATALLHDSLKKHLKPAEEAQALYLLGRAYEVLDELGSWNLHETYFESCVRKAPKTSFAKLCYARLEASVFQGYSGSSGTHIPAYERDKLKTLKDML